MERSEEYRKRLEAACQIIDSEGLGYILEQGGVLDGFENDDLLLTGAVANATSALRDLRTILGLRCDQYGIDVS